MPFGGLFLTGGLTPKNIDRIKNPDGAFMTAYYDKGRVSPYLLDIPLYAVMVEDLGMFVGFTPGHLFHGWAPPCPSAPSMLFLVRRPPCAPVVSHCVVGPHIALVPTFGSQCQSLCFTLHAQSAADIDGISHIAPTRFPVRRPFTSAADGG